MIERIKRMPFVTRVERSLRRELAMEIASKPLGCIAELKRCRILIARLPGEKRETFFFCISFYEITVKREKGGGASGKGYGTWRRNLYILMGSQFLVMGRHDDDHPFFAPLFTGDGCYRSG